jgi:hypothetical protein
MSAFRSLCLAATLMLFGSWLAPAEVAPAEKICVYSPDEVEAPPAEETDLASRCGGRLRGYWSLNWCEPGSQSC